MNFMQSRIAQNEATLEAKSQLLQYQASTTRPITIDIQGVLARTSATATPLKSPSTPTSHN